MCHFAFYAPAAPPNSGVQGIDHAARLSPEGATIGLTFTAVCSSAAAQSDAERILRTAALTP